MTNDKTLLGRVEFLSRRVALIALLSLPLLAACAETPKTPSFTGQWNSTWRGGNASMTLLQTGDKVTGTYSANGGTVSGVASGLRLTGEWVEPDKAGSFTLDLLPDGQSFAGGYTTMKGGTEAGYWTGVRLK